jgi:hypothetical protein
MSTLSAPAFFWYLLVNWMRTLLWQKQRRTCHVSRNTRSLDWWQTSDHSANDRMSTEDSVTVIVLLALLFHVPPPSRRWWVAIVGGWETGERRPSCLIHRWRPSMHALYHLVCWLLSFQYQSVLSLSVYSSTGKLPLYKNSHFCVPLVSSLLGYQPTECTYAGLLYANHIVHVSGTTAGIQLLGALIFSLAQNRDILNHWVVAEGFNSYTAQSEQRRSQKHY